MGRGSGSSEEFCSVDVHVREGLFRYINEWCVLLDLYLKLRGKGQAYADGDVIWQITFHRVLFRGIRHVNIDYIATRYFNH